MQCCNWRVRSSITSVLNSYEVPAFSLLEAGKGRARRLLRKRSYTFQVVSQTRPLCCPCCERSSHRFARAVPVAPPFTPLYPLTGDAGLIGVGEAAGVCGRNGGRRGGRRRVDPGEDD